MDVQQAKKNVDEIFYLYEQYGDDDYIGEPVSQLEHMVQAAELAEAEGYEEEVILAALFHDIGHLCEHIMQVETMDGYGVADHDAVAGNYLRSKGFSEKLAFLAESHVLAKRYLISKIPGYYDQLSAASKITLQKQGGLLTAMEAENFENHPLAELMIKIRQWDDSAKIEGKLLTPLEKYKQMAIRHLSKHTSTN